MHFLVSKFALKVVLTMKCRWNRYPSYLLLPIRYGNVCFYLFFFFFFVINNISITHLKRAAHCGLYLSLDFFLDLFPTGYVCPVQGAGDKQ